MVPVMVDLMLEVGGDGACSAGGDGVVIPVEAAP
jgi:hypothetical protein